MVSGLLLGLGRFMWKESVVINRISLFGVPWLLAVIVCLMRWMYAPQQRRYLYSGHAVLRLACATIHQSLTFERAGQWKSCIAAGAAASGARPVFRPTAFFTLSFVLLSRPGNVPALAAMTFDRESHFPRRRDWLRIAASVWLTIKTQKVCTEWKSVLLMGLLWAFGRVCLFV